MDALPYVDTLFKEYLLFRGFTTTLETFNKDLASDPGCGFQAERITELIFRKLIPKLDFQQLVEFLEFLNMGLYSRLDSRYESLVSTVEADLLRLYIVTAHSAKRTDKIAEFFKIYGPQLLSNSNSSNSSSSSSSSSYRSGMGPEGCTDWREWFLLPYLQHPEREQRFQVYFSSEWSALLEISFRNFLSGVMRCLPLPAVLRFNTDRRLRLALQQQVHVLQDELDRCRKQLEALTAHHEQQQQQAAQQHQQQRHLEQQSAQQQQGPHELQQAAQPGPQQQPEHHQRPFEIESLPLQKAAPAAAAAATPASEAEQIPHRVLHGLHRRDLSLDNWQQQQHRKSGPGTSRLQPGRRSSTGSAEAAVDREGQELHVLQHDHPRFQIRSPDLDQHHDHTRSEIRSEGSGLFELLPTTTQPPQRSSAAGSAAAAAAVDDDQQQQAFAVVHRAIAGSPAHQRRHSRTSSLSGAISFEPSAAEQQQPEDGDLAAAAAAAAAGAASTPPQQPQPAGGLSAALVAAAGGINPAALTVDVSVPTVAAAPAAAAGTPGSSTAPSPQSSRRSSSSAATAAATLSTSPVMSWASGMQVSSSAAGLRSRHSSHTSNAGGSSSSSALAAAWDDKVVTSPGSDLPSAAVVPVVLLPVEPICHVSVTEIPPAGINHSNPSSSSSSSSITCVAFSPSGSNVATAYADGAITIWTLPAVQGYSAAQGNAARRASFACGAPVTSLSWDTRADKLMLIGCAAGGGVRAWHADTKRVMSDVGPEPGFPHVVAVAACPAEPIFAVAANSRDLTFAVDDLGTRDLTGPPGPTSNTTGSSSSVSGRLVLYNSRSFKRSAVLSVPGDVALVSLAYSSTGSQLVAGTAAGTALLYEPASRNTPTRVWHVAAAVSINSSNSSGGSLAYQPVQVTWCPDPAGQVNAAAAGGAGSSSSNPGSQSAAGVSGGSGSVLMLCGGVLCQWALGSSSRAPVIAVDVIAAAVAAVRGVDPRQQQQQQQQESPGQQGQAQHDQHEQGYASGDDSSSAAGEEKKFMWSCSLAASADGKSCAVLCAAASAGALLLYTLEPVSGDAVGTSAPQVLLSGSSLAGGGSLTWHPSSTPLVVGCARRVAGHLVVSLG